MMLCVKPKKGNLEISKISPMDGHATLFEIEGSFNQKPFGFYSTRGLEGSIQDGIDAGSKRRPLHRVTVFNSWHAASVLSERKARGMQPTHTAEEVSDHLKNHR